MVDDPKSLKYDYTYRPPKAAAAVAAVEDPLAGVLGPGEKLLWSGTPPARLLMFRWSDLAVLPFFVFWTGFSLFWEAMALAAFLGAAGQDPAAICMPLFGLPFVGIGLYMLGGRFLLDAPARRRTVYAVTDQRAIVKTGLWRQSVVSVPLDRIDNVELVQHRNGEGTLIFSCGGAWAARGQYYAGSSTPAYNYGGVPVFDHIANPQEAYSRVMVARMDLQERLQRGAGREAT